MEITIRVEDCTLHGKLLHSLRLQLPSKAITAQELIRRYVLRFIEEQSTATALSRYHLFSPAAAEALLNNRDRHPKPEIDLERQCQLAFKAFERNGFLLLVDDRQIEQLDDSFFITPLSVIQFLRLTPLVGG